MHCSIKNKKVILDIDIINLFGEKLTVTNGDKISYRLKGEYDVYSGEIIDIFEVSEYVNDVITFIIKNKHDELKEYECTQIEILYKIDKGEV